MICTLQPLLSLFFKTYQQQFLQLPPSMQMQTNPPQLDYSNLIAHFVQDTRHNNYAQM